jgi:hypothetical protein
VKSQRRLTAGPVTAPTRRAAIVLLALAPVSCAAAIPALGDVNELVLRIREYDGFRRPW